MKEHVMFITSFQDRKVERMITKTSRSFVQIVIELLMKRIKESSNRLQKLLVTNGKSVTTQKEPRLQTSERR